MEFIKYAFDFSKLAQEVIEELKKIVIEHNNIIDLQNEECDIIYGLIWHDNGECEELPIKGLVIYDDILFAILDNENVEYTEEDFKGEPNYCWYSLDGSSDLYSIATIANIVDCIDEYIEEIEYIE